MAPRHCVAEGCHDTDEAAVIALWNEDESNPAPHNDAATVIRQELSVDRNLFLVEVIDGAIAGTAMGGYDGHRGCVYAVMVARSHGRQGLGSALLRRLEELLIGRGCTKVNLLLRAARVHHRGSHQHGQTIVLTVDNHAAPVRTAAIDSVHACACAGWQHEPAF